MLIGLRQIKGIGYMFANSMLQVLKISPHQKIGNLTTEQISAIEKIIEDPKAANFPIWFLNRRQDIETGDDMHLVTSDIAFNIRNDVEREKALFSWRGYRHMYGLKVRGQRTRCTGRKGGANRQSSIQKLQEFQLSIQVQSFLQFLQFLLLN